MTRKILLLRSGAGHRLQQRQSARHADLGGLVSQSMSRTQPVPEPQIAHLAAQAWKDTCDKFSLTFTPKMIVELAGKPTHELFAIICERSGKVSDVFWCSQSLYVRLVCGISFGAASIPVTCTTEFHDVASDD
jgi:hypothetical protein